MKEVANKKYPKNLEAGTSFCKQHGGVTRSATTPVRGRSLADIYEDQQEEQSTRVPQIHIHIENSSIGTMIVKQDDKEYNGEEEDTGHDMPRMLRMIVDHVKEIAETSADIFGGKKFRDTTRPARNTPNVLPVLQDYNNFFHKNPLLPNHNSISQTGSGRINFNLKKLTLDDVLREKPTPSAHGPYRVLTGPAGSGKTFCMRKIAVLAIEKGFVCIVIQLKEVSGNRKMTLQRLLVDSQLSDAALTATSSGESERSFTWMIRNQRRCVILIDGLDEATFQPKEEHASIRDRLKIKHLIGNLCSRRFLPEVLLCMASRPDAVLDLPAEMRPDTVIYIGDLSCDDVTQLLDFYSDESGSEISRVLLEKAPNVIELARNPLLLRLLTIVYREMDEVTNMTGIFRKLLDNLRRSRFTGSSKDLYENLSQLGKLAYEATNNAVVVMRTADLERHGLHINDVKDLAIILSETDGMSSKIYNRDKRILFIHLTVQEYLAAYYISVYMKFRDFESLCRKHLFTALVHASWQVVRNFCCGLLLSGSDNIDGVAIEARKEVVSTKLLHWFSHTFINKNSTQFDSNLGMQLMFDLQECTDPRFLNRLRMNFSRKFVTLSFRTWVLDSKEKRSVNRFLDQVVTNIDSMELSCRNFSETDQSALLNVIKDISGEVKNLLLTDIDISHLVNNLVLAGGVVGKVSDSIHLQLNHRDDVDIDQIDAMLRGYIKEPNITKLKITVVNLKEGGVNLVGNYNSVRLITGRLERGPHVPGNDKKTNKYKMKPKNRLIPKKRRICPCLPTDTDDSDEFDVPSSFQL